MSELNVPQDAGIESIKLGTHGGANSVDFFADKVTLGSMSMRSVRLG